MQLHYNFDISVEFNFNVNTYCEISQSALKLMFAKIYDPETRLQFLFFFSFYQNGLLTKMGITIFPKSIPIFLFFSI